MRSNATISIDAELLTKVRAEQYFSLSAFVEEKLKEKFKEVK